MAYSIQQQSVLYNAEFSSVSGSIEAVDRAVELAERSGFISGFTLRYGDCSPRPCFSDEQIEGLKRRFSRLNIEYTFFNANLGSAKGHNTLAQDTDAEVLVIQNPDVVPSPRLYEKLLSPLNDRTVGVCEAKQLPIEHPKDYDVKTGETSWASTACVAMPAKIFRELNGFDDTTFFLYCDDVDMSWRVRLAGYKVIFQPSAVAFHDKRLSNEAAWQTSAAERYYSAEAALLLTYKWSRPDLTKNILRQFREIGDEDQRRAADEFIKREAENRLPEQMDADHKIGQFIEGNYARHRYAL